MCDQSIVTFDEGSTQIPSHLEKPAPPPGHSIALLVFRRQVALFVMGSRQKWNPRGEQHELQNLCGVIVFQKVPMYRRLLHFSIAARALTDCNNSRFLRALRGT